MVTRERLILFRIFYLAALWLLLLSICFSGTAIAAKKAVVNVNTIKKIIASHIETHMPWPKGTVRYEFFSDVSNISLEGTNITYRVASRGNEDYIGYSNYTIRFYDSGIFIGEKTFRVRQEILKDVVLSSRNLGRGDEIGEEDITVVKKWFDRLPRNILSNTDEIIGMRLSSSVKQGTPITRNVLSEPMAIKRGKLVRIVLNKGPLSVSTIGVSEENGAQGDLIRVKNVSSQKIIYATVRGESLVSVEY